MYVATGEDQTHKYQLAKSLWYKHEQAAKCNGLYMIKYSPCV